MKRSFLVICILLSLVGAVSAAPRQDRSAADGKITVIATIFAPFDFSREIAGDKISLSILLPPGAESHSFEPTPRDIIRIQNSDVFIYIGGESDSWVDRILGSMDLSKKQVIKLIDCVNAVEEEVIEGMQGDAEEPEYDEHIWTSPKNAELLVKKISDALCQADSKNADFYRQNTNAYLAKLDELDRAFKTVVNNARRKTIVFGDRFPFRYFADAYGLAYYAAFPGCSTETEPIAATVAFLINKIRNEKIPVIFYVELSNERMANTISEETGAKKLLLHACHNISKQDFDRSVSYLELMRRNVEALREALQ